MSPRAKQVEEVLTVREASLVKGISENSLRIAIRDGRLKAEKHHSLYVIRRSDLDAWTPTYGRPRKDGGRREQGSGDQPA